MLRDREQASLFPTYARLPIEVTRGEGVYLYDVSGNSYLDFFGGLAVNLVGHANPRIVRAATAQMGQYMHLSNYYLQEPQIRLAEQLAALTGYERVFFTNSGTETMEAAVKLARKWGRRAGKGKILSFEGSFHGRTMGSLSMMSNRKYREGYGPFLDGFMHLPFNDVGALESSVDDSVAAVFLEFIQGEGGIRPATMEFARKLFALRDQFGFLVVADEIQSGLGRTGKFFAWEYWPGKPDLVAIAKGIGGGLPLGCLLSGISLSEVFGVGGHGTTFGGNPVACSAGSALLELIVEDNLLDSAARAGAKLLSALEELRGSFPEVICEVRGRGCMIGMELAVSGDFVVRESLRRGLLVNCTQGRVIRLLPPVTLPEAEGDRAVEIIADVLAASRESDSHPAGSAPNGGKR